MVIRHTRMLHVARIIGIFGSLFLLPAIVNTMVEASEVGTKDVFIIGTENMSTFDTHSCTSQSPPIQRGVASWYGEKFHGRMMANGKTYDMNRFTVAHRTLPFGTQVCITNPENGRSVKATVTDRGPYVAPRIIDLSRRVARELAVGLGMVEISF